ncbi:mismatch repair endonuclease PMS2 [Microplitis mediator]|uniref:mismatch repair endonuclease PMS2 n=1 Tax=Microplitis mediator TaxID=375433 RepID=UPI002556C4EE|nr:mismatch repair endonuclease PMS2 [Microplitis mediator]
MDNNLEAIATTEKSRKINVISKETVHHICSGQVVLDLAVAIKELVENSVDSGATCIDVKLIDYGKTSITVSDNGSGVLEQDFVGLGLKHHTSKLREFTDLQDVSTFGFRGEALSSLCSLSDVTITTKHCENEHAYKLQFDRNGKLEKKEVCARETGTTVCVKNIFKSLPVRIKEFEKNIKREFSKAIQILYGYCLVSTGIKITCTNKLDKKLESLIVATNGADNVLENAHCIFGKKNLNGISLVDVVPPDQSIKEEFNLPEDIIVDFTWEFYISSCEHSMGRGTPDRQFFFVNGRPCNLTKTSKLINNLYHKYNNKQYPFIYLNLKLNQQSADVNVTPDKRTIFLLQEKLIFATIKMSLQSKWSKMQGNFSEQTLNQLQVSFKRNFVRKSSISPPSKKPLLSSSNSNEYDDGLNNEQCNYDSVLNRGEKINIVEIEKLPDREIKIDMETIVKAVKLKSELKEKDENIDYKIKFRAEIDTAKNDDAEEELKRQLTKENFTQMEVIGQFNLGFIITKLDGDIFIVDQHASDEKYRFEKLNNETKLKTQKLVIPKPLNLTAVNETILLDHQDFFHANGFTFEIYENEQVGKRVKLVGMPVSGNWQFGQTDIEELIFLIKEGDSEGINSNLLKGKIIRPTRVRDMLASRACRSAVMIGTALNTSEMERLLTQMSQMENPWNCPHGRPTIRHLLSLKLLHNS